MKIADILKRIDGLMSSVNITVPILPPALIQCGVITRPGLSTIKTTQEIIKKLAAAGFPITDNPDGTANMTVSFVYNAVEGIYKGITHDAVVEVSVGAGTEAITFPGLIL